ncbi:MAG: ABC transporter ATP-binding protein [Pseudomonadota bacterium]
MSLLQLSGVTASYGASQALFGVDLEIAPGEIRALLGRNGMGKSTTVKAICRMVPTKGAIRFAGRDITALPSHAAARLGLGLVPEGRRCFAGLTVQENLIAAARPGLWRVNSVSDLFPRLGERLGQRAASLSGGEQQMLAIGRALMTNPRLLLLDEATEGLAPLIRREIWTAIRRLKAETGLAILLIDKSLAEIRGVSDTATLLERGKSVWDGGIDDLTSQISGRYLGV